ncbi:MAG: hypothetical protein ABS46_11580 [Cytophagaceae bacterium SCN 52-12]|nr:MAG: hypothetical protein ABS46_11580 [Cytophagaceae bacterium SCN 52-12]
MKLRNIIAYALLLASGSCTDLSEEMYDRVGSGNFIQKKDNLMQVIGSVYARAHNTTLISWFFPQELTADQILTPTRGIHGYNAGEYLRLNQHNWSGLDRGATMAWTENYQLIGFANHVLAELPDMDYGKLGLTETDKKRHIAEIRTLRAYGYWHLLEIYGGVPIVTFVGDEVKPRNSDEEVYDFIVSELNETLPDLALKGEVSGPAGLYRVTKGFNRFLLMRVLFNSEAYIRKPAYEETRRLAEEIINGTYGQYALDNTWNGPFTHNNSTSPELIFAFPIEKGQRDEKNWWFGGFHHYQTHLTFGSSHGGAGWNGWGLAPSKTADGKNLDYRLGMPFSKYHEKDVRKKSWNYLGNGNWEGMFLQGLQLTFDKKDTIRGVEEYKGRPLVLVDFVARASEGDLASGSMLKGEENTGIRPVKVCPVFPDVEAQYEAQADQPEMRLAEAYLTLAECEARLGNRERAAELVNRLIKRNYKAADWENSALGLPLAAGELDPDGYRMLEEWGKEFIMEGRRRTDLIRWKKYTTDRWFDHNEPSAQFRTRMPVPQFALNSNPLLQQNDGYN